MIPINWLAILPKFLGGLAIMFALYTGYAYIKQTGYDEATVKCEANFKKYEDMIGKKVENIENLSTTLVLDGQTSNAALAADVATILKNIKTKPLTVVKNGECTPSKTYSDSITEINERVNKAIKESQK